MPQKIVFVLLTTTKRQQNPVEDEGLDRDRRTVFQNGE